jgi:hypothetical protein
MADTLSVVRGLDPGAGQITISGVRYDADEAGNFTLPVSVAAALFALGTVREIVACATADLPLEGNQTGQLIFDTSLNRPVFWNGTAWVEPIGDSSSILLVFSTSERVESFAVAGQMVYDSTLNKIAIYDGAAWRDAVGTLL